MLVSSRHPDLRYLHNNPWPKNDYPNRAFSSAAYICSVFVSLFCPLWSQRNQKSISWAGPLQVDAHDPVVILVRQFHNVAVLKMPGCKLPFLHRFHLPISDIDIWEPRQCDIGNATAYVIVFENDLLVSPRFTVVGTTLPWSTTESFRWQSP